MSQRFFIIFELRKRNYCAKMTEIYNAVVNSVYYPLISHTNHHSKFLHKQHFKTMKHSHRNYTNTRDKATRIYKQLVESHAAKLMKERDFTGMVRKRTDVLPADDLPVLSEAERAALVPPASAQEGKLGFYSRFLRFTREHVFSSDLSRAMDVVIRADPEFTEAKFLKFCEEELAPSVLVSILKPDPTTLRSWCTPSLYEKLEKAIDAARSGLKSDCRLIDIHDFEVERGKSTSDGPLLVVKFLAEETFCLRDTFGRVEHGGPDRVKFSQYEFHLVRNLKEKNRKAAWTLVHLVARKTDQVI